VLGAVVAERVEVGCRGLPEREDALVRDGGRRGRGDGRPGAGAALGAQGGEDGDAGDAGDRGDEHRDDRLRRPAQAQRQALARRRRQGAQDRRRLAGRLARAGGLDGQDVLEVGDERLRRRVAAAEVLRRGPVEHRGERAGDLGPAALDVGQLVADVLHRDGDLVLAVERDVAR
jgi:hypothetical protein